MKKILVTIAIIAAIIGLANNMAFAEEKAPQIVTGTITYNGAPVSGATVKLYNSGWCYRLSSFPSTTEGLYEIRGSEPAGTYYLTVNVAPNKWARASFYYPGIGYPVPGVNLALSTAREPLRPPCNDE